MVKIVYPFTTTWLDYPDNESLAVLIYFIGCSHECVGCQNPEFQNLEYNERNVCFSDDMSLYYFFNLLVIDCKKNKTNKVVFSGGDPLYKSNLTFVKSFLLTYHIQFDICVYTGFKSEYIIQNDLTGFKFIKCNKYDYKLKQTPEKTNNYIKFASTNQELYDKKLRLLSNNGIYYF